jgi:hypothetical protein
MVCVGVYVIVRVRVCVCASIFAIASFVVVVKCDGISLLIRINNDVCLCVAFVGREMMHVIRAQSPPSEAEGADRRIH